MLLCGTCFHTGDSATCLATPHKAPLPCPSPLVCVGGREEVETIGSLSLPEFRRWVFGAKLILPRYVGGANISREKVCDDGVMVRMSVCDDATLMRAL